MTLEREVAFLLNPAQNKSLLPTYMAHTAGLHSAFMIPQYTMAGILKEMQTAALPYMHSADSGNGHENVTSLGWNQVKILLKQVSNLQNLMTIYTTNVMQAYSLRIKEIETETTPEHPTRQHFKFIQEQCGNIFPLEEDNSFQTIYKKVMAALKQLPPMKGARGE